MNRAALLLLTTITGLGALYTIYLTALAGDGLSAWQIGRAAAAVLVFGASGLTWYLVLRPQAGLSHILKLEGAVVLAIGVVGLGANAFVGGRTNEPDGPVFVLSLLLILQGFLMIAHAARQR